MYTRTGCQYLFKKYKVKIISSLFFILTFLPKSNFAHQSNMPGPHGGYIKMPWAFHTELVFSANQIKIYFFNMNFKNPMVSKSKIVITYEGKQGEQYNCKIKNDYFLCKVPKDKLKNYKSITIESIRNTIQATKAEYTIPF